MQKYDDYFIKIYNSFIIVNSENKLTVNELSIYCYLYTLRTYEERLFTNYDILSVENIIYKNPTANKKEIKKCIDSLREKNIISVEEKNKSLKITFLFEEKGHVQIKYNKFRSFTNPRDLYIYVAVAKWEKFGGAKYSNNDWADLLGITREHAISVIESACERGIIYKKVGTYTGNMIGSRNQKIQEKNTYSIKPFVNGKFKIEEVESEILFGSVKETPSIPTVDLSFDKEEHNWNNNKDLSEDDFVFYLNNRNDKEIKEMCEKKIKRILSKNEKFKFVLEKLMNEAEEIIASSKREEREKEESRFNEQIKKIIEQTGDVVLQINKELIPYKKYGGKGNDIEKIYYFEKEDISSYVGESGAYIHELRVKVNPQVIDIYRKENGQWRESFNIEVDEIKNT